MITKFELELNGEVTFNLLAPNVSFENLSLIELAVIETYLKHNYKLVKKNRLRKEGKITTFPVLHSATESKRIHDELTQYDS